MVGPLLIEFLISEKRTAVKSFSQSRASLARPNNRMSAMDLTSLSHTARRFTPHFIHSADSFPPSSSSSSSHLLAFGFWTLKKEKKISVPPAGYRVRLGSSTDKKDTGRLHVDFAQARDDLYEWECRQRMLAREERHRRRIEEDRLRPPSPPPIVHYSEHECSQLGDKIKGWQGVCAKK